MGGVIVPCGRRGLFLLVRDRVLRYIHTMASKPIQLVVTVDRKQPVLPRFAVVPAEILEPWRLSGTTVVETTINGTPVSRRTIKRWDDQRWFLSITAQDCKRLSIDTGDRITLDLRPAPDDLPAELSALLASHREAAAAWESFSEARRRDVREIVAAAKLPATRARRARAALLR